MLPLFPFRFQAMYWTCLWSRGLGENLAGALVGAGRTETCLAPGAVVLGVEERAGQRAVGGGAE